MVDYQKWFENEGSAQLSAAGAERRVAMRDALTRSVRRRRQTRAAVRSGGTAGLAIGLAALLWAQFGGGSAPIVSPGPEPAPQIVRVEMTTVRDDVAVLQRYEVAESTPSSTLMIDDQKLVELLAEANRTTGLIRSDKGVFLTEDVVDEFAE